MARSSRLQVRWAVWLWVLALSPIPAQDTFLARRDAVRAVQPTGIELQLSASKTRFYWGEIVPLTLTLSARERGLFVAESLISDRARLNDIDEFVVDPVSSTEDPLRGLPGESSGMEGVFAGNQILGPETPFRLDLNLNESVRFLRPGAYRVFAISRRVSQVIDRSLTEEELRTYRAGKAIEVVSNVLTVEVLPAPAAWVSAQIAEATEILDRPFVNDAAVFKARRQAGLTLRFLDTVEAAVALARRLSPPDLDTFALRTALLDSSHRAALLPELERLLVDPEQRIPASFLDSLARLAVIVEADGVLPPYPQEEDARQAHLAEAERRLYRTNAKQVEFAAALVRSLPNKRRDIRVLTLETLLAEADNRRDPPSWAPGVVDAVIADFRALPRESQENLLGQRWHLLREANILPLLLDLFTDPLPVERGSGSIAAAALLRIYELDPGRGRDLILAELRRPEGSPLGSYLLGLPDENLPELDPILLGQMVRWGTAELLIARYASGGIVKQVEAAYREQQSRRPVDCPYPLVSYFLKYDPEYGERELREALARPACHNITSIVQYVGRHAWSPALERLAMEYVHGSAPLAVKRAAAEALTKFGSPAAKDRLWAAMEGFRDEWKDREELLAKPAGRDAAGLELALVGALAHAQGWVLEPEDLRRLITLCASSNCRATVESAISAAENKQVAIFASRSLYPGGDHFGVAQYYDVTGFPELAAKLKQFAPGTAFQLMTPVSWDGRRLLAPVEEAIRAAGHRVLH